MSTYKIILASGSVWRKRLLKKHGIKCRIHVSGFKELKSHRSPRYLALYNAIGKAHEVGSRYKGRFIIVIGIDTIGVLKREILSKPRNRVHAGAMLKKMSGETHRVISGVCMLNCFTGKEFRAAATTFVSFKKLNSVEIERYLRTNQWKGKAGAYAIQAAAKSFVSKIKGGTSNVVGIPVALVKNRLKRMM